MMARSKDKESYGTFSGLSLISHFIVAIFAIIAGFTGNVAMIVLTAVLVVIKILMQAFLQKEVKAFRNMRNAQETNTFLLGLRQKIPQAWIHIECWHTDTQVYKDSNGNVQTKQEKTVTFRQDRYLQVTGFYDTTPPLYVRVLKELVYLELHHTVEWLGISRAMIDQLKIIAYRQNQHRDSHCDVTFHTCVPGLTESNYLRNGQIPGWINPGLLWGSIIL